MKSSVEIGVCDLLRASSAVCRRLALSQRLAYLSALSVVVRLALSQRSRRLALSQCGLSRRQP